MEFPKQFYIVVCNEWDGNNYHQSNVAVYSTEETAQMAAEYLQGKHKMSDIAYAVDVVDFYETWK